jgi:hypothetical protein
VPGFELEQLLVFIIEKGLPVTTGRLLALMCQILQELRPMNEPMKYRQNAVECYQMARLLLGHREKEEMLAMAQSWRLLAALAERNCHLEAATTDLTGMRGPTCKYPVGSAVERSL